MKTSHPIDPLLTGSRHQAMKALLLLPNVRPPRWELGHLGWLAVWLSLRKAVRRCRCRSKNISNG